MKTEISKLLDKDCIIIFDTNVYLNLYEYSPQIADFFLEISKKVSSKIVLPNTVKREFDKNHKECHGRQKKKFDNVPAVLKKSTDQMEDKISKQFCILKNFQFPEITELEISFKTKIDEIKTLFDDYVDEHNIFNEINDKFLSEDNVYSLVQKLVGEGKLLSGFNSDELYNICDEGERRYKNQTPPGYKDGKDKTGIQMYNDLIIWKEVLRYCSQNKKDLIFVTDDVKEDWWILENNKRSGFRKELGEEFNTQTSQDMIGITSGELFAALSDIFEMKAPDAFECVLGFDIQNYIDGIIDNGIIGDIMGELSMTGEDFVDVSSLTGYDGSSFEISNDDENAEFVSYEFGGYVGGHATYFLTVKINVEAYSQQYYGRDDDTKEIILSDQRTHILSGQIEVKVTRNIEGYINDLTDDYSYSNIEIINGELKEDSSFTNDELCVECGRAIGEVAHQGGGMVCYDCAVGNEEGEICPSCGEKVPHDLMAGNGFCTRCTNESDYL